jgi:UPF0716 protein FxsA
VKLFAILTLLFILLPAVEFGLLIEIGSRIGTIETLVLVLGTGLVGAYLARLEGFRILSQVRQELEAGRVPGERLFDGLLVLVAAIALITPGLLTDVAGLLLLLPPTRYPVKALVRRKLSHAAGRKRIEITPF